MFAASFDSKMGCLCSVFDVKKQGKPIWEVRTRNWKLREGENRLSGLLEGIPVKCFGMIFGEDSACCSPNFCNYGVEYRYPISGIGTQIQHWNLGIRTC
ncbi:hypothetical protein GQ457_05G020670 [Hibiscus cannabinus]